MNILGLTTGMLIFFLMVAVPAGRSQPNEAMMEPPSTADPVHIRAERIELDQVAEIYRASGSVEIVQGLTRLTADEATVHKLTGRVVARGHVHLSDQVSDVWAHKLEINMNTEVGVITNGKIFLRETNTWVRGRQLQRLSETHYRVQDGTFTNCDAEDGQIPDWSFSFQDVDLEQGDHVFARNVWFRVRDFPLLPLPAFRYPLPGARKTGFLVPTVGIDNVFGVQYRQAFFWAISPSQDLTLTPQILTKRGEGGDVAYRYILSRRSRGKWLVSALRDTKVERTRAQITGLHVQALTPRLLWRMKVNYATDRTLLQDLSNAGIFRALPSQESLLTLTQQLPHGRLYLKAQYLQPLNAGGRTTFQRIPELGYRLRNLSWGRMPFLFSLDTTFVHFFRERGFNVSRLDLLPTLTTQGLHLGHMVGLHPQIKFREVLYSHGRQVTQESLRERGTVWVGMELDSRLSRRFQLGSGRRLRHTIAPKIFYEFVPQTTQADLPQIDAIDNLPRKHLLTYALTSRLTEEHSEKGSITWLDFILAQSYHLGDPPGRASIFSDIWGRATLNVPARIVEPFLSTLTVSVDSFFDPGEREVSQWNTDLTLQAHQHAYVQLGYRHSRAGTIPRRGDIWNPLSFNEVLVPQTAINFLTAGGAVRTPFGWSLGTKIYHDFESGQTSEWDVVGLYQNPCRCWSLGLYFIRLGGTDRVEQRNQFNFVLTLRGIGATPGLGAQVLKSILGPLLKGEVGVPWAIR
ncbi:MAG: LPS-assembly protein LptD [Nitrospirae bacterium]|nr:MAG: LPS-assembly protein LptD [Nitrospirota bacterium]